MACQFSIAATEGCDPVVEAVKPEAGRSEQSEHSTLQAAVKKGGSGMNEFRGTSNVK